VAARIPDELIDEIRSANDIVEVISERIPTKRAGRNYKALCPFHQEKTPSFNINPERQIYHCFGCGAGGNVISFLMEYEKVGFLDAIRELADRAGISLPRSRWQDGSEADDPIYASIDAAVRFYRRCYEGDTGEAARDYWRKRGLSDDTAATFQVGYAPPGWDSLLKAVGGKGITPAALEEAGLAIRRDDGGHYDRFRDRLVFPLLVSSERAVGFGGRALGDQEPKYLNSPETAVYHKGRYLYGLAQARPALRGSREAILVEGYMDLVSLHQDGFKNVVASSGTAFTPEQGRVIARYADKVFVAYDGDSAGMTAATKAAEILMALGLKVRVARFPEDSDPDTYLREKGPDALKERLETALDFIDFLVAVTPTETPDEREAAARRLIEIVARIEDPLKADLMLEKISEALSIRKAALARAYASLGESRARRGRRPPPGAAQAARPAGGGDADGSIVESAALAAQKGLLSLLLAGGAPAEVIRSELSPVDFEDPIVRSVVEAAYQEYGAGEPIDAAALLDRVGGPEETALLTELSVIVDALTDGERLCDDYIRTIRRSRIEGRIRELERAIEAAEMTNSDDELLSLVGERQELARRLTEL
jgi:DNA primase